MVNKTHNNPNNIAMKSALPNTGSLQTKTTRLIVFVALTSLFLGGLAIMLDDISQFKKDFSNKMALIAKTVGNYAAADIAFKDQKAANESLSKLKQIPGILNVQLYDEDGKWFISLIPETDPNQVVQKTDNTLIEFSDEILRIVTTIVFNEKHHGYIELIASTEELGEKIRQRLFVLAILAIILAFISYLLARGLQHRISQPILDLAETAKNITVNNNYNLRVKTSASDEIATLYDSFNQMLDKIVDEQNNTQQVLTKLSDSEARFSAMFNAIPDAVLFADTNRQIKLNNPAVFNMFQYSNDELIGQTTEMLYPSHDAFTEQGKIRFNKDAKSQTLPYEVQYRRKDGSVFWTESLGAKVLTAENKQIGFIGIFRDITERKKNEEELSHYRNNLEKLVADRTHKLEALNEELKSFSYSVSHDLRSPLRSIDGFSQALLEDYSDVLDEMGKNYLSRIRNSTQNMGKLIDDMLSLSRISSHEIKITEVNLSNMVSNIINRFKANEPDRKTEISVETNLKVQGDSGMLEIMLNNLIGNAWKYSGKKDLVEIQFFKTNVNGLTIFCIKDKGDGFNMDYIDKMFLPFHRLHKKDQFSGTGIGLAIVKRVIDRHGGKIWAEGKEQDGAVFCFTLPE